MNNLNSMESNINGSAIIESRISELSSATELNSWHSVNRAKERAGMNYKKAQKMMNRARERGIGSESCRWSLDRQFLESRTNDTAKAIEYNGFCFIFDRETNTCITMYGLPPYFGKKKTFYKQEGRRNRAMVYCW